jgi:large subunit ribosomal protein L3
MKFIIGKKMEMTQIWQGDNLVAVTKVQAGPCRVSQVRTIEKDGYQALQLSYGARKTKNIRKPQLGHLAKAGIDTSGRTTSRYMREFRISVPVEGIALGDQVKVSTFAVGDKIGVTGISKGKGFQGPVKRHHFKGTDEQHGNKDQSRMPGSIGAKGPAHVFKGTKMAGRMGADQVTIKSLEVIEIDQENDILYIKGGLPGAKNGLILIAGEGELVFDKGTTEPVIEEVTETVAEEAVEEKTATEAPVVEKEADTPEEVEKEVVEAKEKVDGEKKD